MADNPINLAIRFILEITALIALALWGWRTNQGLLRVVLALGLPLLAAVLWGVFRVPGDPGEAPVAVPGWMRLLLEWVFFTAAVIAFWAAGLQLPALVLGGAVLLHYLVSYDRVLRLLGSS